MRKKFKDIVIKSHTCYFFDDIISTKSFDPNKINIYEKSHKNILICYTGHVTIKNLEYVKINSVNPSYPIINKVNGYFEVFNSSSY